MGRLRSENPRPDEDVGAQQNDCQNTEGNQTCNQGTEAVLAGPTPVQDDVEQLQNQEPALDIAQDGADPQRHCSYGEEASDAERQSPACLEQHAQYQTDDAEGHEESPELDGVDDDASRGSHRKDDVSHKSPHSFSPEVRRMLLVLPELIQYNYSIINIKCKVAS